ncbi:hypothetical protein PQQ65_27950 [Paraburkholderia strydomiana]|uniref:hypothetical protein n=1 Tax=Paraburkholderia strydomiana TaxID=1245417 RepID=UPI0038BC023B
MEMPDTRTDTARLRVAISRLIDETIEIQESQRRWGMVGPFLIGGGSFLAAAAFFAACFRVAKCLTL